jgi:hypothetical protein
LALITRIHCRIGAQEKFDAGEHTIIGIERPPTRVDRIYRGAPELLDDFFDEVERVCRERGISDQVVRVEVEDKNS